MEKRINIAKKLKDCPKGMDLDCTMFNNAKLKYVSVYKDENFPICIETKSGHTYYLTKYGQINSTDDAKCIIFPKGKDNWKDFVPPCNIKDGDILISVHGNPFIFKETHNDKICGCYCGIAQNGELGIESPHWTSNYNLQLATEEEKQKLFDAIRENGYKWNSETKTLEKLIEPNFKDGDILSSRYGNPFILKAHLPKCDSVSSYCAIDFDDNFQEGCDRWTQASGCRLATEEEKKKLFDVIKANWYQWNAETKTLEKLIVPKFKVGDKIKHKVTGTVYNILFAPADGEGGGVYDLSITNEYCKSIDVKEQDNYELVPDKFNISTLVPFESKVLIRNTLCGYWEPAFWGAYTIDHSDGLLQQHDYLTTKGFTRYCIPYDGNEHLIGKTDDCIEYYKTWEE